jgi:putative FmdB family regulatory protein
MPLYEYFCEKCRKEVTIPMSISEHEKGSGVKCPDCGGSKLTSLVGAFFSKTSRKS